VFQSALAGEVFYEDAFVNLDPSWSTPSEILSAKDGKLTLKRALNSTQSVLNQSKVFDDSDIQVDVTMSAGDANVPGGLDVPGGLIFWAKDYRNFYCLCTNAIGSFKISHDVGNQWQTPVNWTENDAINKDAEPPILMVSKSRRLKVNRYRAAVGLEYLEDQRKIHQILGNLRTLR